MPNIYDNLLALLESSNPESGGWYNDIPAADLTWVNNVTRLNATNMNSIYAYLQGYARQVGTITDTQIDQVLAQIIQQNAGWKLSPTNNPVGEIFNDYQNNQATANYSHAQGQNTQANHVASDAGGTGTKTGADSQTVRGTYNNPQADTLFEIGNGTSDSDRKNAFTVKNDGNATLGVTDLDSSQIPSYDPSGVNNNLVVPKGYVDKKTAYLNQEVEELKQLNEWLGSITVTSAQYHNQTEFFSILDNAVKEFTKDTDPPDGRTPRNGDQITVDISDRTPTDPQYPEIWMWKQEDPKDETQGQWKFFSSLQQLVNASKTAKGLVQIGDNINVTSGLISVPVATDTILGVVKNGANINNNAGTLSVPIASATVAGVVKIGNNVDISDDGTISVDTNQYWIDWA